MFTGGKHKFKGDEHIFKGGEHKFKGDEHIFKGGEHKFTVHKHKNLIEKKSYKMKTRTFFTF